LGRLPDLKMSTESDAEKCCYQEDVVIDNYLVRRTLADLVETERSITLTPLAKASCEFCAEELGVLRAAIALAIYGYTHREMRP
jgi:hypothetical protein